MAKKKSKKIVKKRGKRKLNPKLRKILNLAKQIKKNKPGIKQTQAVKLASQRLK